MFGGYWEGGNMTESLQMIGIAVFIFWFIIGGILSVRRLMDWDINRPMGASGGNWFDNLSWGQIIMLSICFGPVWLIIIPVWSIVLLFQRGKKLFDLLANIGPRN